jgi:hypothetical protein
MLTFIATERDLVKCNPFSPTAAAQIAFVLLLRGPRSLQELIDAGVPVEILSEVTEPRRLTIVMDRK